MARQGDQKSQALSKALKANMAKRKAQAKALAAQGRARRADDAFETAGEGAEDLPEEKE